MTWILPKQLHTLAFALDTEALSLDSNEQSQICAQSLFVRSKPSQLRIWSLKWKRDSWTRHLFGRILRPSLGQRFATEWTSSLGAIHVSPSVQPGSAEGRTTQGTSGPTSQREFDFSDLGAASLRMSKDISRWGCPTSLKTWQEWVIERRGAYSQRLNAERHTNASGCSSWPTMTANEAKNSQGKSQLNRTPPPLGTFVLLANSSSQRSTARLPEQGSRYERQSGITQHGGCEAWPSRPGERQYGWEPPRVVADSHRIDRSAQAEGREHDRQAGSAGEAVVADTSISGSDGGSDRSSGRIRQPGEVSVDAAGCGGQGNGMRQTQPSLGGDPDGPASGMDYAELCITCDNRTDELRLLGNGVVPATAERAFRVLIKELL